METESIEVRESESATTRVTTQLDDQFIWLAKHRKKLEWLNYRKTVLGAAVKREKELESQIEATITAEALKDRDKVPGKTVQYEGIGGVSWRKTTGKVSVSEKELISEATEAGLLDELVKAGVVERVVVYKVSAQKAKKALVATLSPIIMELLSKHVTVGATESVKVTIDDIDGISALSPMSQPLYTRALGE